MSRYLGVPARVLPLLLALLSATVVRADSITQKQIAREIKQGAVLSLHNDVAQDLAENILAAQLVAPYGGPLSLSDSITAVLKAISLEQSFGLRYCDDFNCEIVWAQSNIAIDPNAGAGFSPTALYFGEVPVSTPEPMTGLMLLIGVFLLHKLRVVSNPLH